MSTWTQADVDTLRAAVASGVLEVRYEGPPMRLVRYQALSEMRHLLASMQREVARSTGQASYSLIGTRKGF